MNIYIETLGCDKNTADTKAYEMILTENGHRIVKDGRKADVIFINTCSFILPAKEESIGRILDFVEFKKDNPSLKIVAVGCLVEQHMNEIKEEIPELDGYLGVFAFNSPELLTLLNDFEGEVKAAAEGNELVAGEPVHYLKIADGCNYRCAYCAIPSIKGPYISRPFVELVEEAKKAYERGAKELVLVAQDIGSYGVDLEGDVKLSDLLLKLDTVGFPWIRLLYVYPGAVTPELLCVIKESRSILPYLDIPMQHSEDSVLKAMGRMECREELVKLLAYIRDLLPEVTFRSTFIVGFPGETEEDFNRLLDFLKKEKIHWAGAFPYFKEDGTRAAGFLDQIPEAIKEERLKIFNQTQLGIVEEMNRAYLGKVIEALVEEEVEKGLYILRGSFQAPDVDGIILGEGDTGRKPGDFVHVKIQEVNGYDLKGVIE